MICRAMFIKIRPIARKPRLVKNGQGIKMSNTIKTQTFFKSRIDGPIIAPMFNNKNKKIKFFQSKILICFRNVKRLGKKSL